MLCGLLLSGASVAEPLQVGYAECFRPRLPLEGFLLEYPDFPLSPRAYARNAWGHPDDRPYTGDPSALPHVFPVHAGRFNSELPMLVERGWIEPLDSWLAELGLAAEMFPAKVREAVTYRGKIWAIPHHAIVDGLHLRRETIARLGLVSYPQSWEGVFGLVAQAAASGEAASFSAAGTVVDLIECMLLSTGGPPLELSDPTVWESSAMVDTLEILQAAHSAGHLSFRPQNTPMRLADEAVLGIGRVESLHELAPFAVIPFPTRLRERDTPAERTQVAGMLEAYVVRSNSPESREQALTYLRWLLSEETEWAAFEATNQRNPQDAHVLDTVHVPLREGVLASLDFEYAQRKYPAFSVVRENVAGAIYARSPAALDYKALQLAETTLSRELSGPAPSEWLPSLRKSVYLLVKNTPAETWVYDAY